MPLDTVRLLDSDLFALAEPAEFRAALILWCKSWAQLPAASLPNDDRILAHLSGDRSAWPLLREMALRGWVLCSDGRLYHSVVAEKANEAWARRGEWRDRQTSKNERQQRWRDRVKTLTARLREVGVTPPERPTLEALEALCRQHAVDASVDVTASTVDAKEAAKTGDSGQGQGTGILIEPLTVVSGRPREDAPPSPIQSPKRLTGCRLAEDWQPRQLTGGTVAAEIAERRGDAWLRRADELFRNHYRKASGKQALASDWDAAWRNWIIKEDGYDQPRNGRANGRADDDKPRFRDPLLQRVAEGRDPYVDEHGRPR